MTSLLRDDVTFSISLTWQKLHQARLLLLFISFLFPFNFSYFTHPPRINSITALVSSMSCSLVASMVCHTHDGNHHRVGGIK